MRQFLLFAGPVVLGLGFLGQSPGQSPRPQSLLRIERVQLGEAICALVEDDGTYRLEKLFRAKTEMYTGSPGSARIDQLRAILANEQLSKLSQDSIHQPILVDTVDEVQLDIWRGRGWQELTFTSPEGRKPFKESLDPLLQWFHDLQKQRPGAAVAKGPPTRCLPAQSINLVAEAAATSAAAPTSSARSEPAYLFRFRSRNWANGLMEGRCTVVFPDGSYRWEWKDEDVRGRRRERVAGGALEITAIQELRQLLDSPEIKGARSDSAPPKWVQNSQRVVLDIPRDNLVQNLEFVSYFNAHGNTKEIGGMTNQGYYVGNQKVLDPLKHWMKEHTDKHAADAEKQVPANDCYPVETACPSKEASK